MATEHTERYGINKKKSEFVRKCKYMIRGKEKPPKSPSKTAYGVKLTKKVEVIN